MSRTVFGFVKAEDSPGFLLWQTTITWQRLIKKILDPYEISHAQFVIMAITLWFEDKRDEINQTLIIQQSKLDKMTVSKSLKILVEKGYIIRAEHKSDIRAKSVRLTPAGKRLISKLVPLIESVDEKFFGTIKKPDQQSLIIILNKLIENSYNFIQGITQTIKK
jgi:MarR family transcriptional regulator, organic hydroperoxide resistance regulator